jgi:hypothetical protein
LENNTVKCRSMAIERVWLSNSIQWILRTRKYSWGLCSRRSTHFTVHLSTHLSLLSLFHSSIHFTEEQSSMSYLTVYSTIFLTVASKLVVDSIYQSPILLYSVVKFKVKAKAILTQFILVLGTHLGPATNFLSFKNYALYCCVAVVVWRPLWRRVKSVVYCCCCTWPAQSLPVPTAVDWWAYFTVSNLSLRNLGGKVPVFIFLWNRVAQLYPRHWIKVIGQSHLTSDGQLASLCWGQATIWDQWPIFLLFFLEIILRQLRLCYSKFEVDFATDNQKILLDFGTPFEVHDQIFNIFSLTISCFLM